MGAELLRSSWLKLERAREHRTSLESFVTEQFKAQANRPQLRIKAGKEKDEWIAYVSHLPDLTALFERVGLILGDAIHNLRSALDHLVFQLATANQGTAAAEDSRTQFPICRDENTFRKEAPSLLKGCKADHQRLIESFQPYHRWNIPPNTDYSDQLGGHFHPIDKLEELSNRDKHRQRLGVVIPSGVGMESDGGMNAVFVVSRLSLGQTNGPTAVRPISLGDELFTATVTDLADATMAVAFLPPVVALPDGRPILPVLQRLEAAVDAVIQAVETAP